MLGVVVREVDRQEQLESQKEAPTTYPSADSALLEYCWVTLRPEAGHGHLLPQAGAMQRHRE